MEIKRESLEFVRCNLCGFDETEELFSHQGYHVVRCRNCTLVYVNPQNSRRRLAQIYDREYFVNDSASQYYKNYYTEKKWRSREFEKMMCQVERFKKVGNLLDVGAAAGFLLDVARNRCWKTWGVEISQTASEFARTELGLDVRTGELIEAEFPANFFDVVTMIDVIEHTKDPKANIEKAAQLLKVGGMLVLSTPNISSLGFKIFGKGFVFMAPEVHLWYFNVKTLSRLLQLFNFRVVKVSYPYFDTPYFSFNELKNLAVRLSKKMIARDKGIVPSAPMRGNLMQLFCVKEG